jgi:hypothetical protein
MRTGMLLAMFAVLLPANVPAGEIRSQRYSEREPLPVDATSGVTVSARLGLEMRRAGGPRREVLESILVADRRDDSAWSGRVATLCHEGVIDCGRFLPFVESMPDRVPPTQRESAIGQAQCLKEEAYLQALPMKQRQALYRQAIVTGHSITDLGPWLDSDNCALRALHDGMDELIPDIERGLRGSLRSNRESIEPALRMRKALTASDPEEALLRLVRHGVEVEVEHTLMPADKRPSDYRPFEAEVLFAMGAVDELRRLNPPGAAERLAALYALYKPAEEKLERERDELLAKEKAGTLPRVYPARVISPAKGLTGRLARSIVETIGDLGDRDFERTVFRERLDGLPTLWDRVNQVEKELVKQGKIKASEAVSGEQQ